MSEDTYKDLFMANRDAIMTLKPPEWRFTSGNPAAIRMFRAKDEQDFLSYEPWKLSPETQPDGQPSGDKAKAMIEKAMQEGSNFFEWIHRRVDGEDFPAEVLLSKVESEGGDYLHATVRDISGRKKSEIEMGTKEEEIKKHTEELERFNELMIGRELEMVELKKEILRLKKIAMH